MVVWKTRYIDVTVDVDGEMRSSSWVQLFLFLFEQIGASGQDDHRCGMSLWFIEARWNEVRSGRRKMEKGGRCS